MVRSKVLIVDGYNVIRSVEPYCSAIDEDVSYSNDVYHRARSLLINDVAGFAHGEYEAYIVFDAAKNDESRGEPISQGGIQIIFSPSGAEADTVIEELARKARADNRDVFVATSDGATQRTVFHHGVTRMSARMFADELNTSASDWAENNKTSPGKLTLGRRLDPEVAKKLSEWVRGQ